MLALLAVAGAAFPATGAADQASQPGSAAAAHLDAGKNHTCVIRSGGSVRCWGSSGEGELGYGNRNTIGDDERPGSVGPVDLGPGRTAQAITAGDFHTCALLDDGTVRCWGFGANGRLGNESLGNVGDNETPGSVKPVELGGKARAISAGAAHTCAILDGGAVRCWGYGVYGQLGNGGDPSLYHEDIGDDEAPGSLPPVDLGLGRTAAAITAGDLHTCAILDNQEVRCWGSGEKGRLGYGNVLNVTDPNTAGSVALGNGRTARAIGAGFSDTCALLDDGSVRCWGEGHLGRLGYGNEFDIGDDETPATAGPVDLGPGRVALAISAGDGHACALLNGGDVRCWGFGGDGRLGYGNEVTIGDDEEPVAAGPVRIGPVGAAAISAASRQTCAQLQDGAVRCWGYGANGRLGLCNQLNIGDDELPDAVAPVSFDPGPCGGSPPGSIPTTLGGGPTPPRGSASDGGQAARRRGLDACRAKAARHTRREILRARKLTGARRGRAERHLDRHRARLRRRCLRRWGRIPGPITHLKARGVSRTRIVVSLSAAGTNGRRPPPALGYLVKLSRRPIRTARAFRRAQTLCEGSCTFPTVAKVGDPLALTVSGLRPHTRYYFAVAAQDNASCRRGPRSGTAGTTLTRDPPQPPEPPHPDRPTPPSRSAPGSARDCKTG